MKLLKVIAHCAHKQDLQVIQPPGQQEDTSAIASTHLGETDYTSEGFLPRPDFHKEVTSTKPQTSSKNHYSYGMFRHCWAFRAQTLRVKTLYVLRWSNSATDQRSTEKKAQWKIKPCHRKKKQPFSSDSLKAVENHNIICFYHGIVNTCLGEPVHVNQDTYFKPFLSLPSETNKTHTYKQETTARTPSFLNKNKIS